VVKVAAAGRYRAQCPKGATMKTSANRTEPKAQALSWLVSQLRWEETLGGLRDGHDGGDASHDGARKAA
jgi:hypothetical protein